VKGLDATTRDLVRTLTQEALEEGWSNDTLADELEGSEAFSEARSERIARTETAFADVQGNLIGWDESGVVEGKEWLTAPDCCDECQALHGEIVPLDEDFSDGSDGPPAHPMCRCDVLPVLREDAEKLAKYPGQPRNALGQFDSNGGGGGGGGGDEGPHAPKEERSPSPPWPTDRKKRAPGKIIGTPDHTVSDEEKELVERLVGEGRNFQWAKQADQAPDTRMPEGWLSSEEPPPRTVANSIEIKHLAENSKDAVRACRRTISESLEEHGQSPNIIIDGTRRGLTEADADAVASYFRGKRHHPEKEGPLWHLRFINDNIDLDKTVSL